MKKIFSTICCAFFLLIAAPAWAGSFPSFDQRIEVGGDGLLTVKETMKVDFPDLRHGIYRDLPVRYKTASGNPFSLRVKIISVTNASGEAVNYTTAASGDNLRVKIGDADVTVFGPQLYVLTYSVSRALLFLPDHDELYWNVIVGSWGDLGLPETVRAEVFLPGGIKAADIKTACYTERGTQSSAGCNQTTAAGMATFSAENVPMTLVVGWPKGVVAPPAPGQFIQDWLADNWLLFWPLAIFALMFGLWYKRGRDPVATGAIVVQYAAPDNVPPAELGLLVNENAGGKEISATIVSLAIKGYLDIVETDDDKLLMPASRSVSFTLKKFWDNKDLTEYEALILNGLFEGVAAVGGSVSLDDLRDKFFRTSAAAKQLIAKTATSRGWFAVNPMVVRSAWITGAIVYLGLAIWLFAPLVSGPAALIALFAPVPIIIFFGYFMPARTMAGAQFYARALGFKEYLSKAEKWAAAFAGIQNEPPSWYHGSALNNWSTMNFVNSLKSTTASMSRALMTAPSSGGGGGLGGGGFGGGGGGSW